MYSTIDYDRDCERFMMRSDIFPSSVLFTAYPGIESDSLCTIHADCVSACVTDVCSTNHVHK